MTYTEMVLVLLLSLANLLQSFFSTTLQQPLG